MALICVGFAFAQVTSVDLSTSSTWKMTGSTTNAIQGGVADGGAAISAAGYAPGSTWLSATVPGTIFSTFVDNSKYTDPYVDRNIATQLFEKGVDLCNDAVSKSQGWWYRTNFTVADTATNRRVWLHFKGINYKAQVWVNGQRINDQDGNNTSVGFFKHFYYDITSVAVRGTANANALAVLILPNTAGGSWHQVTAADHGSNGGVLSQDGPTVIPSGGWDWIPTIPDRDAGILDQVMLETKGPATIKYPFVQQTVSADYTSASITVSAQMENNTANALAGTLTATLSTGQTVSAAVNLTANQKLIVKLNPITISNVKLWWPNGYGAQNLYTCDFNFTESGKVSDDTLITFGCRSISYTIDHTFLVIWINGKRIMCKGGNWGLDEAMKRWDTAHMEMQVRMSHDLHMTMFRNWVGQTDRELFYSLCDKYGILIWDDFWMPHPNDGPDPTDQTLFMNHAMEKIKRGRNHPCLALYCNKNEGDRNGILDAPIKACIDTCNPGMRDILFSTNSPDGVQGNGPYGWRKPDDVFTGASGDHVHGFTSEIGMPCPWVYRTGRHAVSQANLSPVCNATGTVTNAYWGWHDFCNGSAMQGGAFCTDLVNDWGFVAPSDTNFYYTKQFCKFAQNQNYDGYRAMFEAYNCHMNDGSNSTTSGCVIWMSNCSWPSNVWQTYDYYGDCNAAGFGLGKACEPVHVQATYGAVANSFTLDVINNSLQDLSNYTASCEVWSTSGTKVSPVQSAAMTFPANSKTSTNLTIVNSSSNTNVYFMNCLLKDPNGKVVSKNVYCRAKGNDWTQLKTVQSLPKVTVGTELTGNLTTAANGSTVTISGTLTNSSTTKIAHMIRLTVLKQGVTESGSGSTYVDPRILPTYYNDNYFSLMPGESIPVSMEYDLSNSDGKQGIVDVTGFTVADGTIAPVGTHSVQPTISENMPKGISVAYVPTKGIVIKSDKAARFSVTVFDMLGNQVSFSRVEGKGEINVGQHAITSGLYFVKLVDAATAKTAVHRVMVR
jgi:hypothetical protein